MKLQIMLQRINGAIDEMPSVAVDLGVPLEYRREIAITHRAGTDTSVEKSEEVFELRRAHCHEPGVLRCHYVQRSAEL
jgi:hypothetical protein